MDNQYNQYNNGAQWNAPEVQWQDATYSSGGSGGKKPPKKKKPLSNVKVTVIACLCSALVASAASVGGFAALVGTGVIPMGGGQNNTTSEVMGTSSELTANKTNTTQGAKEEDTSTLQGVADKALKSVVLIQAYSKTGGTSYGAYYGFNFHEETPTEQLSGEGSGVIATSDGYLITNHHVVKGASSLKVTLPNGEIKSAKIVGSDAVTDLALLKVDANNLDAAEFGESGALRVGDRVLAVGNPGGSEFQSSVTFGFVSALDRTVTTSDEYKMTCIQTDTAINPGNSGGALVNNRGQVIGICSSKIVSTSYEGLGFAIPIDTALPIINDLRENGKVTNRAALGVTGQYVDSMTASYYGLSTGYYVAQVNNSSAANAGLRRSDIITKIDDTAVTSSNALTSFLVTKKPGDTVTLTVDRNGKTKTMEIKLQEYTGD